MKLLKKSILVFALFSLTTISALANNPRPAERPSQIKQSAMSEFSARLMTNAMSDSLDLSANQIEKVYLLNYEFAQKQNNYQRELRSIPFHRVREMGEEIQIDIEEMILDKTFAMSMILNDEQLQSYTQMQQEMISQIRTHRRRF